MCFPDEYNDEALIKWEILSRVEYAINAGTRQRINLHNLALSLNGTYKIKEIVDLIYAVTQTLDGEYYRIKITAMPYYFTPHTRSTIYDMAKDFCYILKDKLAWPDTFFGQIDPAQDWKRFEDDKGNYLFIKVSTYRHGQMIERLLLDYCNANRKVLPF